MTIAEVNEKNRQQWAGAQRGNRAAWKEAVESLKAELAASTDGQGVEILSGPCAGMVVKTKADVHRYACRLDEWFFPPERPWGT